MDFELILVDQTGDPAVRLAAETAPFAIRLLVWDPPEIRVRPPEGSPPSNASGARNHGALHAAAQIVAFTDDDCVPDPEWVEKISLPLRSDPSVIMTTGQNTAIRHPKDMSVEVRKRGRQSTMITAATAGSSSLAVRRTVFLELGGFDTSIGPGTDTPGCEDVHLIYRFLEYAEKTGSWVAGRTDAIVIDDVPGGFGGLRRRWRYMVSQGAVMERQARMYGDPLSRKIVDDLRRASFKGGLSNLRRGNLFWAVAGPMSGVALTYGRLRWERIGPSTTNIPPLTTQV
jgi:glycosyltransferase involved in cell wall biosynthesis